MNSSSTSSSACSFAACSSRPALWNASIDSTRRLRSALEHLELLVLVQRALQLLLGRAQAGQDHAARRRARVAFLHRGGQLIPRRSINVMRAAPGTGRRAHASAGGRRSGRRRATEDHQPVLIEARDLGGVGDEVEHALALVGGELADVAEGLDVAFGMTAVHVGFGLMSSIASRPLSG
jgi:hypothetical protein